MVKVLSSGIGRRKTSVARVYVREGPPGIMVNNRKLDDFFRTDALRKQVRQPLVITSNDGKLNILITVRGGGVTGQAGAARHGVARALAELDETNRPALKTNGFLTRDARMVERKKYGRPGARKKFQFSKR
ncbi:SSU ribosomal protein S9p (S16e) [Olavius algarvensis spirochete endosymbiont]|uniref:30S ribosomal protein S9 n=1 Tax=Olavius algarvensis spirochete endosymbiont TaxID=260710 RepID=UPI00052E01DC|nr:30S ribosomal protein S9 [Olavius algarvensis spirochete endosymbiont]KGM38876.1 30S ribosomal protein S9 [Alkalispirochaeta odontotermitis]VDB01081.1 SSU ribosomal protein S9p (S16e) [Olavius algarvensis spirochete endosymbiont]